MGEERLRTERDTAIEAQAATIAATLAASHQRSFIAAPRRTIRPSESEAEAEAEALRWLASFARDAEAGGIRLEGTLGEGGMGVVREATQESLGRTVAAKTLREHMREPTHVVRLLREAWITGTLEHPNVIPVHTLRVDAEGAPLVVLKKIEGEPWSELLEESARLPTEAARRDPLGWHLEVLRAVCNALAFAHSKGIVHRDVKPENVLVGPFGEVYLADWGIAVGVRDFSSGRIPTVEEAPAVAGTPAYMAPEMVRGAPPDARTDVYLLGGTLFEILSGRPPHEGDTVIAMLGSILTREPELPADAPAELAAICHRALATEPADRFPTADAFAEAIDAFRSHREANRLAADASERLERLAELVEAESASPDEVERVFGACRFGFMSALAIWPESERAGGGLDRAIELVVEHHLRSGDPQPAAALAAEHSALPRALAERIERALTTRRQERALLAEVKRERRQMDPRIGRGRRIAFALTLGVLFVIAPVIGYFRTQVWGQAQHPRELLVWPVVGLVVSSLLSLTMRRALWATRLNRRLMGTLIFAMFLALVMHLGGLRLGLSVPVLQVMDIALFFGLSTGLVAFVARGFWPTALAFLLAFGVGVYDPELRWHGLMISNVTIFANFWWLWPPFRRAPHEGDDPPS